MLCFRIKKKIVLNMINNIVMKIGIIRETKIPEDNRVALTPDEIVALKARYPNVEFVVQSSATRAYHDNEYKEKGIVVREDVDDCDILFGIKEADIDTLIPQKHYFFFGHIAKMQPYNKPLIKEMMRRGITFSDYEYLVDDRNQRLCAFGWWAGVVGVYNTLRAFGLRKSLFALPAPDKKFTKEKLLKELKNLEQYPCKIIVTGNGRVSHGAQYVLDQIGFVRVGNDDFVNGNTKSEQVYAVADVDSLVKRKDGTKEDFNFEHFTNHASLYESDFLKFARVADVLVSGHYWNNGNPVYLSKDDLMREDIRMCVIGDITCDIQGSIKSTLRSSTHAEPFYDYNPDTGEEEPAFSSERNITVMAVDTLPNALALDTSRYFGEMLSKYVLEEILSGNMKSPVIQRATILEGGKLTPKYKYLEQYAEA